MATVRKVIIIGGVAAGPKTAARLRRLDPTAEITIIERGRFISYAGCSLPYYVAGLVKEQKDLSATPQGIPRDPAFFQRLLGVKVLTQTEALRLDPAAKRVEVRDAEGTRWLDYDMLVLATGARPVVPSIPGAGLLNVFTVHRIEDAEGIRACLGLGRAQPADSHAPAPEQPGAPRRAVIIGGGLIGVEMAEALVSLRCQVTLVEALPQLLPFLDPEMARLVQRHIEAKGVQVLTGITASAIEGQGRAEAVTIGSQAFPADVVIIAVGVRPNSDLAAAAGLELGPSGAIKVDSSMRTSDTYILATGDCTEDWHLVAGQPTFLSNGANANKKARVAANTIAGREDAFPGILGTAIVRAFDLAVARTGLTEKQARKLGHDTETCIVPAPDKVHHYPGAKLVTLKLIADRRTRKLLGAQGLGPGDVARRVDVLATALAAGMTVDQLAYLDLCYAPPFSAAMDNVIVAANVLRNKLDGLLHGISPVEVKAKLATGEDFVLLDVRTPAEHAATRIPAARHIPLAELKDRLAELPRDKEIVAFCAISLRGYSAERVLRAHGFTNVRVMDGGLAAWPYERAATQP